MSDVPGRIWLDPYDQAGTHSTQPFDGAEEYLHRSKAPELLQRRVFEMLHGLGAFEVDEEGAEQLCSDVALLEQAKDGWYNTTVECRKANARLREAVRRLVYLEDGGAADDDEWKAAWDEARALAAEQGEPEPCEMCGGSGTVALGEHFVTQDMATDAGEPDMAGMPMRVYGPCPACAAEQGEPK